MAIDEPSRHSQRAAYDRALLNATQRTLGQAPFRTPFSTQNPIDDAPEHRFDPSPDPYDPPYAPEPSDAYMDERPHGYSDHGVSEYESLVRPINRSVENPRLIHEDDPKWMWLAFEELGVTEIRGPEHHPRVLDYHAVTTLGATTDEVPWCSSFVCWVIEAAGMTSTASAASLSWLRWGKSLSKPRRGCVVVCRRKGADGQYLPNRGHVGFYLGERDGQTYLLGGNQANSVNVTAIATDRIVDYRWPASSGNSTTVMASGVGITGSLVAASQPVMSLLQQGLHQSSSDEEQLKGSALASDPLSALLQSVTAVTGNASGGMIVSVIGCTLVIGALGYIIVERRKKMRHYGI